MISGRPRSGSSGSDPIKYIKEAQRLRKEARQIVYDLGWVYHSGDGATVIFKDPDNPNIQIEGLPITISPQEYKGLSDDEKRKHGGIILPAKLKKKKSKKKKSKKRKSKKRKIPKRNNKKRSYNKRRKMRGGSNQIEIMSDFKKEQEELRLLARDNDKAEFKGKFNEMIKMVNFDSSSSKGTESFLFNFIEQYTGIDTRRLKYKKGFTDDWLSSRFEISTLFLEYDGGDYAGDKHIIKLQICPSMYRYLFIEEWYKSIRAWYAGLSPKPIFILLLSNEKDGKDYIFMSFQKMITWDEIIHIFPGKGIGRYPLWQEEEWAKIYDFPEGEQKPNSEVEHALKGLNERLKKIEGDDPELKHIDLHNENIVFETESGFIYAYIIDWGPGWGWGRPPVSSDVR